MATVLEKLMSTPLPTKTKQKRCLYRPNLEEVYRLYDLINKEIFKNKLSRPEICIGPRRMCWGMCVGFHRTRSSGSRCVIKLSDKWYCIQWFVTILAHEMSHQYQWDILSPKRVKAGKDDIMSHGPSFFVHRSKIKKHSIPLKTAHSKNKWFKYQHMQHC